MKIHFKKGIDKCALCSNKLVHWRKKNAFGNIYNIDKCKHCGFGQVNPMPKKSSILNFYRNSFSNLSKLKTSSEAIEEEKKFPNAIIDAERIFANLKNFSECKKMKTLLDVGCGYGFFSREASLKGFDVTAIELDSNSRMIAENIIKKDVINIDFESISNNLRYEVILMSQVLEHVTSPVKWIAKCNKLQKIDDFLIIAVPNFESIFVRILKEKDPMCIPPEHLNYFTFNALKILLNENGYSIIYHENISRINLRKIKERFGIIGFLVGFLAIGVLNLANKFSSGMFINIYAQKKII